MTGRININKRSLGVNFNADGKAEVLLWAPQAGTAAVVLPKSTAKIPLRKDNSGHWHTTTDTITKEDLYFFQIDNKIIPDPASLSQPGGVHGSSSAFDISGFPWTDKAWKNIPLEQYIIYEIHTGTFTPDGNFSGIETKLEHLKKLGITAIELMPVAQFPGDRNWGYDGVAPFAVQHSYGGASALQRLINSCHQKGIAVVLDVVYNHVGPEGAYLGEAAPYFTNKHSTPWGAALNFDDTGCDGVRRYFIENALMWFRDFHIDALRLDAVHAINDCSSTHFLKELKQYVDALMQQANRNYYLMAESDLNDTRLLNPLEEGGFGIDAQWTDDFHHALRVTAGGSRTSYYSDFNGIAHLAKSYKNAYVYSGQYSPYRKKAFGTKTDNNPGQQFIVFSQNHDQVGNRMLGERTSRLVSFEMRKLVAGAVLLSPYLPLLFMGEEWSETAPFLYFTSHTDPRLAEAVRQGRKKDFAAFQAQGEAPDPQSEKTFQHSKLQWDLVQKGQHKTMFRFYQALILLRKQHPALSQLARKQVSVACNTVKQTLTLHRWQKEHQVVCIMNFSKEEQRVTVPHFSTNWTLILYSAAAEWDGPASPLTEIDQAASVIIQPESIIIYTSKHV